ncbi:MBL fold metallo-hydrolase [Pseudoalteromonas aurantia]|uniref:MBL fold metallo-hydrolase n=1 Tax=Pseudoalteromonas aurantia TaxID=43654 RepID=UPI001787E77C|nr:MBL fold metallo-hydrolase [Pseudoalteromonas aurantia]
MRMLWIGLSIIICAVIGGYSVNSNLVANVEVERKSAQYDGKQFNNLVTIAPQSIGKTLGIVKRYITENRVDTEPTSRLPMAAITTGSLAALSNDKVHIIKLGHSSILLKVKGKYWLLDPVFSERASPFSFLGPKRFQPAPISIAALPNIDKVIISHNHYDHLDKAAVRALAHKTAQFLVPLGVEGDLAAWGIDKQKIVAFDWWQELETKDTLVAFTPTQHFSGRGLSDANTTLWGSWVIKTDNESLYFSGDSGYFPGFKTIGDKYGPFDYTLIEAGAYDEDWADVHMTPEQSVQAHIDLQGKVMIPIHNSTFDLAFHAWYEPLERALSAADKQSVVLNTPIVGEVTTVGCCEPQESRWWHSL